MISGGGGHVGRVEGEEGECWRWVVEALVDLRDGRERISLGPELDERISMAISLRVSVDERSVSFWIRG